MKPNRILVCSTCQMAEGVDPAQSDGPLQQISEAIADAGLADAFSVGPVACMGGCQKPMTLGFQGEQKATFVFSGVQLEDDMAAIISTCHAYLEAEGGWIEDGHKCGRLRDLLRSRVPAMDAN